MTYPRTPRTTPLRYRERISYERAAAWAILDEAYYCHVSFLVDGEVRTLPTLHVRVGDTVYLHGSTGSRLGLSARAPQGLPVCLAVTHLDGIVYGRSQFHHSANYRSVIAHGTVRLVTEDAEKRAALAALIDKVGPGRSADSRPPTRRELAETAVLALPLTDVSVKSRAGGPVDDPNDLALPYWAGVLPLRLVPGVPEPAPDVTRPVPDYLRPSRSRWQAAVPRHGTHVTLAPLDLSHVDELFAATADDQVWPHYHVPRPTHRDELADLIGRLLRADDQAVWVCRRAGTGEVVGAIGYRCLNEPHRTLVIDNALLAPAHWHTPLALEAHLMLLRRAFDELGAVRVAWHTDIDDEWRQDALRRLGAVREGVLRAHRPAPDGSWRDTVLYALVAADWPAVRAALVNQLAAGAPVKG